MTNIVAALRDRMDPDAVAFLGTDGAVIQYRKLDDWIGLTEQRLRPLKGRRIALSVPRSPLGLALFLGVILENICCPMSSGHKREEAGRFFETTETEVLIASETDSIALDEARSRGIATLVFSLDEKGGVTFNGPDAQARDAIVSSSDPYALLLQTSGTTSNPKVVLLTHLQIMATASGIVRAFGLAPADICLNPMPFNHGHGLITAGLSSLLAGSRAICLPGFSPGLFSTAFERFRPTWFTGSPAMHIALLDHYKLKDVKPGNPALRFFRSSSAPLPSTIIGDLETLFGAPLIETYGLTETATMIVTNPLPPGYRKVGSVGLPCSGAEVRIVTADGRAAAVDQEGEILVRGPSIITHYGALPMADPDNFTEGWLRTGDIGCLDIDGYLFIRGRTKELIKRGGLSVYPNEVDSALLTCANVVDAATFSIPHRTLGEDLVSAVVIAEGTEFSETAIRRELLSQLSSYKVPSAVFRVPFILKSETGKIARREMGKQLGEKLTPIGVRPESDRERSLLALWSDLLKREDLGITDNIFLYGADPMLAEGFRNRLFSDREAVDRGFAFRFPTVREQAYQLDRLVGDA